MQILKESYFSAAELTNSTVGAAAPKRSTLLRLERMSVDPESSALELTRAAYAGLAEAVLRSARAHGYLGEEPLAAAQWIGGHAPEQLQSTAHYLLQAWTAMLSLMQQDGKSLPKVVQQLDAEVQRHKDGKEAWRYPVLEAMAKAVALHWERSQAAYEKRLTKLQEHPKSVEVAERGGSDDLAALQKPIWLACQDLGIGWHTDKSLAEDLELVLDTLRKQLRASKEHARSGAQQSIAMFQAIQKALFDGKEPNEEDAEKLPGGIKELLDHIVQHHDERGALEEALKKQSVQEAEQTAALQAAQDELAQARQRIAELSFGVARENTDDLLEHYRELVKNHAEAFVSDPVYKKICEQEFVLRLAPGEEQQAVRHAERYLSAVLPILTQLFKNHQLGQDPKVYKARRFKASAYPLKTVMGMAHAFRDIAQDLRLYVDLLSWVEGVNYLAKHKRKLEKIFRSLVRLIGDCRAQIGIAPPVSATLDLGCMGDLVSLPHILAEDLESLLRKRAGKEHAKALADLLQDSVEYFAEVVAKSTGKEQPRSDGKARESAVNTCKRYAQDLRNLTATAQQAFNDAIEAELVLAEDDELILDQRDDIIFVLQQLDQVLDMFAVLRGAPAAEFDALAAVSRLRGTQLHSQLQDRALYLDRLSAYRCVEQLEPQGDEGEKS